MLLARGEVQLNGQPCRDGTRAISPYCRIEAGGELIQSGQVAHYLMLNKPAGYLSATSDPQHPTVMELLPPTLAAQLHIGGRLDRASTGLLILTNDGLWSRRLTAPELKKPKTYRVTLAEPIHPDTARVFAEGIHFPYEGITTSPAQLEQLEPCVARLTIYEGRYHQIKRMFGRFRNPVVALHRESMGPLQLGDLAEGGSRPLSQDEIAAI
ncbi:16S rRNA pseudouridine(516) synthase [Ferrimonas pelagia]|uniref:Pseudouridine synthase n=1 Tax=Ferrimonas pelagia TaxID=1177826 RepID=A0ABP9EGD6_9GAMM